MPAEIVLPDQPPEPVPNRLAEMFDPAFWSSGQQNAFLAACWLLGRPPDIRNAWAWKHCRGEVFNAYRALTGGQRDALRRAYLDRRAGGI
jgi:hypothetical protein